jgi:hypothetical protein
MASERIAILFGIDGTLLITSGARAASHDVDGAHAAGMAGIGVGSNDFTVNQLREEGADYAIALLAEGLPR